MAEIYVHFTEHDGVIVTPRRAPVFSGETIHWRVVSDDEAVYRVRIKFSGPRAPLFFFSARSKRRPEGQAIFYTKYGGGTVVSGVAPVLRESQALKYSVAGLTKSGKRVKGAYRDPVIIIDPPGFPPTPIRR